MCVRSSPQLRGRAQDVSQAGLAMPTEPQRAPRPGCAGECDLCRWSLNFCLLLFAHQVAVLCAMQDKAR